MEDLLESLLFGAACILVMWALDRLAARAERRKSPEQRKAEERWKWKHGRW